MKTNLHKREKVKEITESVLGIKDISTKSRYRNETDSRKIYCMVCIEFKIGIGAEIGSLIGIDHSTVVHHSKTGKNLTKTDIDFRTKYHKVLGFCINELRASKKHLMNYHLDMYNYYKSEIENN